MLRLNGLRTTLFITILKSAGTVSKYNRTVRKVEMKAEKTLNNALVEKAFKMVA